MKPGTRVKLDISGMGCSQNEIIGTVIDWPLNEPEAQSIPGNTYHEPMVWVRWDHGDSSCAFTDQLEIIDENND